MAIAKNFSITKTGLVIVYTTDASKPKHRMEIDATDATITETNHDTLVLADATEDQALSFGGITDATKLIIISDVEVTVKINGTDNDPIPVEPLLALLALLPISPE